MKKRFCLIGIITALIVAGVALASCSNLIEDLKAKDSGLGMWPQTIKAAGVTVDESDSKVVGIFTYYKGSDGAWYVKQQEKAYSTGYKYSDGTDVAQSDANSYKYFKVEPIKWVVLTDNYSGKKLLHSEKILIGRRYDDDSNNYRNSEIRSWLNGDFYNTAFTSSEQNRIADTNVDNSARSTNPDSNPNLWNSGANSYACEDTTDKIFLLSEQEVTNSEYGFAEYDVYKGDSNGTTESTRIPMTTDFAKASGAYQNTTEGYGGGWWLRSPTSTTSTLARGVSYRGGSSKADNSGDIVYSTYGGVCPALCLN